MKIKIQAANVGQTIIDPCGYIYVVEKVYDKYVSIGNGEFIMHQDYEVIEDSKISDFEALFTAVSKFYSEYTPESGYEFSNDVLMKISTRMHYKYEEKNNPRHAFTFEDFEEKEGDEIYEYEFEENPEKVS